MNGKETAKDTSSKSRNQRSQGSTEDSLSAKEMLDLLILIGWTRDMIRKVRQKELAPYGLNPDKGAVLQVIHNFGGYARADDIARQIVRERHSVHELLRRMEKSGLLREVQGLHRKNGVCFELTDQGHAAYRHVNKRHLQFQIFSSLSRKKREQLAKSLRVLHDAASKTLEENRRHP